ncbi:hypothetical protein [Methanobrevibacter sp. 87.7]|uniref:hypothetical protein n=1 Tax=Methanobrevibacter sp. 87.7 TaxID=387957 RepID=UPI001E5687E9|nr:hypothetical protein [Methanobrevibacter sp. 87.7]
MITSRLYDNYKIDFKENYETNEKSYFLIYYENELYLKNDYIPIFTKEELYKIFDIDFDL